MKKEQKELGWTTRAFFPDVTDIKNHERTSDEALVRHYRQSKSLVDGALAIITAAGEDRCDYCHTAHDLLTAFLDAMEMGGTAFDEAHIHNQPPFVTLDELRKMLGDRGMAEVAIRIDREGFVNYKMVRIGHDYSNKAKKDNGKKQGKAA
jgi:hypothetical protein